MLGRGASGQHVFGGRSGVAKAFWKRAALAPAAPAAAAAAAGLAVKVALFLPESRGTSSLGAACFWRLFRLSVAGCFGVAKDAFWRLAAPPAAAAAAAAAAAGPAGPAAELALFLPESRRDVRRTSTLDGLVWSLGANVFGGRAVLQGPGVLLFRRRPLELRCGAVLRAWERHFGAIASCRFRRQC